MSIPTGTPNAQRRPGAGAVSGAAGPAAAGPAGGPAAGGPAAGPAGGPAAGGPAGTSYSAPYAGASGPGGPGAAGPPEARRMHRPSNGRVLVGVCIGLAEHLAWPVKAVRWGFVIATITTGIGLPAYLLLWIFTPASYMVDPTTGQVRLEEDPDSIGTRLHRGDRSWRLLLVGALLVAVAVPALVVPLTGLSVPPVTIAALVLLIGGAVLGWSHLDAEERRQWLGSGAASRSGLIRVVLGAVLAVVGAVVLAMRGSSTAILWDVLVAVLAVLAGLVLVLAPWALRFWKRFQSEQTSRIREKERADIAAHLHDSVLQTLALIQRTDDPARITQLARAQERELRLWLYGKGKAASDSLATAATDIAAEVEDLHGIPVDLVVTGDRPLDDGGEALVRALREALLNAVRHGAPPVTAYVEVGPRLVEAFVRDHGAGFDADDLADVPEDRLGVRESILGRMSRHGGTAKIRRLDTGTEVALSLPVEPPETSGSADPSPAQPADPAEPAEHAAPAKPAESAKHAAPADPAHAEAPAHGQPRAGQPSAEPSPEAAAGSQHEPAAQPAPAEPPSAEPSPEAASGSQDEAAAEPARSVVPEATPAHLGEPS